MSLRSAPSEEAILCHPVPDHLFEVRKRRPVGQVDLLHRGEQVEDAGQHRRPFLHQIRVAVPRLGIPGNAGRSTRVNSGRVRLNLSHFASLKLYPPFFFMSMISATALIRCETSTGVMPGLGITLCPGQNRVIIREVIVERQPLQGDARRFMARRGAPPFDCHRSRSEGPPWSLEKAFCAPEKILTVNPQDCGLVAGIAMAMLPLLSFAKRSYIRSQVPR